MTRRGVLPWIAAAALLGVAGCGSDDDDNAQAPTVTVTVPAAGRDDDDHRRGHDDHDRCRRRAPENELSPEGRAVLAATEDLAADVSKTAEEFTAGRIDDDEAMARLELARDRAADLRDRAEKLPAADRARGRLASLNEEISAPPPRSPGWSGRAATQAATRSTSVSAQLRDEARSTYDAVREQLDPPTQERFRDALDQIGVRAPG